MSAVPPAVQKTALDMAVSLVNHSNPDLLAACLRSLHDATHNVSFSVWVVDNATDRRGVAAMQAAFPRVQWLLNERPCGFSANHNQVLTRARARYYCVLNDDTVIHDRALDELVAFLDSRPDAGIAGPRLLNPDGTLQISTFRFPGVLTELAGISFLPTRLHWLKERGFDPAYRHDEAADVDWVLGACLLVRDETLRTIGPLDALLSPLANNEEMDWCRRAWSAGWKVTFCPAARLLHYGGQSLRAPSRGPNRIRIEMTRTRLAYFAKHDGRVKAAVIAGLNVATLPWNAFVLFQSSLRRRTPWSHARNELVTFAGIAATGLRFVGGLFLKRRNPR